jgi:hypothetical protein
VSPVESNTRATYQAVGKTNQILERVARRLENPPTNPLIAI